MNYKEYKFSDLIEEVEERNTSLEYGLDDIVGVTIEKGMIPTIANLTQTALDKFYIVKPDTFVYNPRTHGVRLGMGYNDTNKIFLTSWNNVAFRVKEDAKKIVLSKYLWIYFNRPEWDRQTNFMAWGSSTIVFAWNDFLSIKIKLPDLKEQEKIVNTYNAITKRIQLKQKINENLEKTAQCLFDELNINKESFEEKAIAEISNSVICGKTPSTAIKEYWGTDIPFITIPDMHGKNFISQTERYLSQEGKSSQENQTLPPKSICVSCIATVGLVSMTTTTSQTNQQINSIICKEGISPFYIFLTLKGMDEELKRLGAGGSTTLNISKSLFSSIKIAIPNKKEMDLFENEISPIFDSILMNEKEISKLQELKQLLISRISGM